LTLTAYDSSNNVIASAQGCVGSGFITVTATGFTIASVTLTAGNFNDFDYITSIAYTTQTTTISGTKFYDANRNGTQDSGEAGVANVTIQVTSAGGTQNVTTDSSGAWSAIIQPGPFTACESPITVPISTALWQQTAPNSGDTVTSASADADRCWTGTAVGGVPIVNLNFGNVAMVTGTKYNGVNNSPIAGFHIVACFDVACQMGLSSATTYTDANGNYFFYLPKQNSTYTIQETSPTNFPWTQTAPKSGTIVGNATATKFKSWSNLVAGGPQAGLNFTNTCVVNRSGGLTIGSWSNSNGQAILNGDSGWLAFLDGLNLRNATGANFDPTNYTAFHNWLLSASAPNMAYMLSAQLAGMELNVREGNVLGTDMVSVQGMTSPISITTLMSLANASLGTNGYTVASGSVRTYQNALQTALANANNNKSLAGQKTCTPLPSNY
jgi:hypothetical protein